jgi:hypothetical protein
MNTRASAIALRILGLASALAVASGAAKAAPVKDVVVTATYSGRVGGANTIDTLGAFGTPGADLALKSFTLTVSEDDKHTIHGTVSGPTLVDSSAAGPNSASLEIDGAPVSFAGFGYLENLQNTALLPFNEYNVSSGQTIPITPYFSYLETVRARLMNVFKLPGAPDYHSYILSGAEFPFLPSYIGSFTLTPSAAGALGEEIDLEPNMLTVTSGPPPKGASSLVRSAVPEPASWALMIGGLLAMGPALRRRRVGLAG